MTQHTSIIKELRKFVGAELKKSYFDIACRNLEEASRADDQNDLFAA